MGQLTVGVDLDGVASVDGVAETSSMNSSLSTRTSRAAMLSKSTRSPDYPWMEILQLFSLEVIKAVQETRSSGAQKPQLSQERHEAVSVQVNLGFARHVIIDGLLDLASDHRSPRIVVRGGPLFAEAG